MSPLPTVEFLVLGFNGHAETLQCLSSIIQYEPTALVTFLDNGSEGQSLEVQDLIAGHGPLYRYMRSDTNLGVAGGRNLLLSQSRGDILIVMDNDARLQAQVSDRIWAHYHADDMLGIIGCEGILLDPELNDYTYRDIDMEVDAISGYFQCIPRSLYLLVGPISQYELYGKEDIDYSLRVKQLGFHNRILPTLRVFHQRHVSSSTLDRVLKKSAEATNKRLFREKWFQKQDLLEYRRKGLTRLTCVECDQVWTAPA